MDHTITAVARLRDATGKAHASLEEEVDVIARLSSALERPGLIAGYGTMYAGSACLLAPWFAEASHRLPACSGAEVEPAEQWQLHTRPEALGFRYVIEGSALGGRVILRQLRALGVDTSEMGFLDPHGPRVGEVWRSFCSLLERELASMPLALDEAVAGAMKGFAYARRCLGARPATA